jgi:hypothetical protein
MICHCGGSHYYCFLIGWDEVIIINYLNFELITYYEPN